MTIDSTRPNHSAAPVPDGLRVNLCCGTNLLPGYVNLDVNPPADIVIDLDEKLLPFPDASVRHLVCISAINYLARERAAEVVADVHRVLVPGGIARFAVQDLRELVSHYLQGDAFYAEKLPDGRDRFPGATFGDKLNEFFGGFRAGTKRCRHVYDFQSLSLLFSQAGFDSIRRMEYRESAIPGIEAIDNRPEQMFFLEAVKSRDLAELAGAERDKGIGLFAAGEKDRGWQHVLRSLELNPADALAALTALGVVRGTGRPADGIRLIDDFVAAGGEDERVTGLRAEFERKAACADPEREAEVRTRLDRFDVQAETGLQGTDEEHLAACFDWFESARLAAPDRGIPAFYDPMSASYGFSYPEVTGYIAATYAAAARLPGRAGLLDAAKALGQWELDIQSPLGGAGESLGFYHPRPRVFNTGQVMLGWLALHEALHDDRFLEAAVRAAYFTTLALDGEGKWARYVYAGPRTYKSRVVWALLETARRSSGPRFRTAAEQATRWILSKAHDNGFFDETSLGDPGRPWTHLTGYLLTGLEKSLGYEEADIPHDKIVSLLTRAARNIQAALATPEPGAPCLPGLPGTLDARFRSEDAWSCLTGNAQIAFFLMRMSLRLGDEGMNEAAGALVDGLKRLQLTGAQLEPGLRGGLFGSWPAGGNYCPYVLPSWGIKFFADALLARMLPPEALGLLG
ncbi:class I SAM-dependent methyltransferase [Pseudodesulfovibrio karagichevae]|uniref:Methyltransferase domain-containing protein n=1 Tax=Pseudodesulfovibrio karagichevae TaxID=3239305 RepID=A0ABV4K0N2_9BACT